LSYKSHQSGSGGGVLLEVKGGMTWVMFVLVDGSGASAKLSLMGNSQFRNLSKILY